MELFLQKILLNETFIQMVHKTTIRNFKASVDYAIKQTDRQTDRVVLF